MRRTLLFALFLIMLLGTTGVIMGQTMEYGFVNTMGTFTPITGGTLLGTETSDDQRFVDPAVPAGGTTNTGPGFPIGFNYTFNGLVFDRIAINNNGWISLGQSALTPSVNMTYSSLATPLGSTSVITPGQLTSRIAALGRDLQAQTGASLRLETIGTSPNQVCVVQWLNYKKYSTSGTGDSFSFQIRLYETSNKVEIVYGTMTSNTTSGNFQVGLRGEALTDFHVRATATDWNATTAGATNTDVCVMTNLIFPPNGLTFTFNYPVANQPPNPANLVSPANGATLVNLFATLNWNSGGGLPTGYKLSFGTNNPPTNLVNNQDLGAVNTYDPTGDLTPSTTYYWKVVPYNGFGDAVNCPVWSFTTHGDPTITSLPYSQTWDLVTPPAMPFDWTTIYQATVTTGYVKTVTTSPNSTPNCVAMYNPTDANTIAMLVGPQLATAIPANTVRVKFWGKGSTSYAVKVGVMTNPADPATFTEIQQQSLSSSWTQYTVSLATYTGTGRYIAFRHACLSTSQTIYLDGVDFELIAPNDLAAVSVTGNATPSVNQATNYTVSIYNWGTATQSAYQVKLMSGTTELASVAGPTIAAGATASAVLSWTPTTEGPMAIFGRVVLTGDANAANNDSPAYNISVQPAGATVVTIGEGNLAEGVPWEFYFKNSLFETMYYPDELGVMGNITTVTFYNNFVTNLTATPVKLWLGTTQLADLSAGWILPSDGLTLVYDGTLDFPSGVNNIVVPLQTPYLYTGGNLVLYANRPMDTQYYSSSDNFAAQTIGTTRARKLTSDSVTYDPAAPSATGTLSGTFPKTSFTFVVTGMGSLSGTVTSGGNPVEGVAIQVVDHTYHQTTSATGQYSFPFLPIGTYSISATKIGYQTLTQQATITNGNNTVLNFNLVASSTVNVTGHVVGSDQPTVGLSGVQVHLDGPIDYDGTTNASGDFTISGVLSGNSYSYTLTKVGYQNLTGTANVGATSLNMGTLTMTEVTNPPRNVVATENTAQTQVTLTWRNPGSTGGGAGVQDFEADNGGWVASSNWSDPLGDWEWANNYNVANVNFTYTGTSVVAPPTAHSGTGMWGTKMLTNYTNSGGFNYLTKTVDLSGVTNAQMRFWSWENVFGNFDYCQVAINGTVVWGPSWQYTNTVWTERVIDLSAYSGQSNVQVQFQMYATTTVNYAGWYIDDLYIGPAQAVARTSAAPQMPASMKGMDELSAAKMASSLAISQPKASYATIDRTDTRTLNGYKVWRLTQGNETNENTWTLLTANAITDTSFIDLNWSAQGDGNYKWAVKGVYTNGVLSVPALSNMIRILRNDLAALTLNGSTTPSVGAATTYTVHIKNTGTQAKTAGSYTVKLMNGTTELASVPGPAIAPNEELDVAVTWTPATQGPVALTGKVVLTADTVPDNNITPVLNVTVMPSGVVTVTIGDGSQTDGRPWDFYYKNSLFQCLYYPAEIGLYGNITAVTFYNNFVSNLQNMPVKLWLGSTQQEDLSTGWILPPQLTLVYDGTINLPTGTNTITVPLQNPFTYLSGNLVLYAQRPMDTQFYNTNDNFLTQTVGTTRARILRSDTTTYDPNAPDAGTLSGAFPKTTLHMTQGGTTPIYSINLNAKNWGTVLINSTNDQAFNITNAGGGQLTITNISISGSPMFSLQSLPTLPANLSFGQIASFTARYLPTAVGDHTATITVTDNLARTYTFNLSSSDASRTPHSVALSGHCIDTTLNTLPYTQNFDAVTPPALPPDWLKLVNSTATSANADTYASTTYAHTPPNCARLLNSTDTNATVMLIAPPLGTAIPTNTTRVKFWARSSSAGYPISVGIMSNPTDANTYTETQSIALTTTITEYVVSFNTYAGTGKHIVFKHGLGGSSRTLYLDDVLIEVTPTNDLAATAIAGNSTPSVGQPSIYTVSVYNWGTAAQNTYNVKLFNSTGTELGTAPGVACAPGATVQVPVSWTPATEGSVTIYGKVVLTGDQNNLNDQSPNLTVLVMPTGVTALTIGDGSQNARMPVDMYFKNSLFETMYYPSEMGNFMGQITGLQFYNNFVTNLTAMPTKVWIGTTSQPDLTAGWIPSTDLTLVFDGTIDYPSGENTITIPFSAPYMYMNNQNLVLMVNRPMDTQYYSSSDNFKAQTDATHTARSRKLQSDSTTYDPAAPATATPNGQFPKTTIIGIPGGVGHLNGTVLGAGNQPLEGVAVAVAATTYTTTTNAQGQYSIQNMLPNTYSVSFSKYGYITQNQNTTILEDQTTTLNINLVPMAQVNVTGTILASDTGNGLSGAAIYLHGYADYNANSTATGTFTIPNVYASQAYEYTIIRQGYTTATGTVNVGSTNHNMGNITLNEVAYAPFGVVAALNDTYTAVNLNWQAPDPTAVEVTESFEATTFPPTSWTQVITNTGPANPAGILPTWCRIGTVNPAGTPITPPDGSYQAGLWWDYAHQNEALLTPVFNCPPAAHLQFASYVFLGSQYNDHYTVEVSTNGGTSWTVLWDATTQTGGWNLYASPITVDLTPYGGQQIKLAWHADDPPADTGLWYQWFIDDIYIGNATTSLRFNAGELATRSQDMLRTMPVSAPVISAGSFGLSRAATLGGDRSEPVLPIVNNNGSEPSRSLQGYKVWRLVAGAEANPNTWNLITPQTITTLNTTDPAWPTLANGSYRWAVKAVYSADVMSVPSFSNTLVKQTVTGNIVGVVRRTNNQPIAGVTVSAGTATATTNSVGAYSLMNLPVGSYTVSATATGYQTATYNNVIVNPNQNTTLNIVMSGVANDDELAPVVATALNGNYPNPFNPETTIQFAIKDRCPVRLEVYNLKGQLVRSLVNQDLDTGHYQIVFDGRDALGRPLASGLYLYRFSAGTYSSTRKMMLME